MVANTTRPPDPLPEGLKQAIRHRRVLPVIGPGKRGGSSTFPEGSTPDQRDEARSRAHALYDTVAEFPCDCVVALTPDQHLARVLSQRDERWLCIEPSQRFFDEARRLLIQLAGSTDNQARMLRTDEDWLAIGDRSPILWELAQSHAARAPLLLLGCDPGDEVLAEVVDELRPKRHFQTTGWFLCDRISDAEREQWATRGFQVVCHPADDLFDELRDAAVTPVLERAVLPPALTSRPSPYKRLDYFETEDEPLYFGREAETVRLVDLVCAHRLVVVTGPSGTGKTSLLKAGLLAWSAGYEPFAGVYARCGENPVQPVIDAILCGSGAGDGVAAAAAVAAAEGRGGDLEDLVVPVIGRDARIPIVVLDQAEELFTRFEARLREQFLVTVRTLLMSPVLPVRIVLSLRDDYLARLADLRNLLPSLLQNTFYVPPLTREAAIDAIRKPCRRFGVPFDDDLAERIFEEIGVHRVAPPQLQIVCDSLYRGRSGGGITADLYERLGGARKILTEFMDQQLEQLGAQANAARDVLKAMVTSEGTKEVLGAAEIACRARYSEPDTESILLLLRDTCRLVRSIHVDGGLRFELAHEYLTTTIWQWMSQEEKDRREMEELLTKELRAWRQFHSIRLGLDRLIRFVEHAHLLDLDQDAMTLLLLSSVTHRQSTALWVSAVKNRGDDIQDNVAAQLFDYFRDSHLNQRCEAAEVIAELHPAPLLRALESRSPEARRAALEMLGGIRLEAAVGAIARRLDDPDEACRSLACGALGAIGGPAAAAALEKEVAGLDRPTVGPALRAVGRLGLLDSCYATLLAALVSAKADLVDSAKRAIAYGTSHRAVEKLISEKLPAPASAALWDALSAMPRTCDPRWFRTILEKLPGAALDRLRMVDSRSWSYGIVSYEYWRRQSARLGASSGYTQQSKLSIHQVLPVGCSVTVAAGVLQDPMYRSDAIEALACRGRDVQDLLAGLATHSDPKVRTAVSEILARPGGRVELSFTESWISTLAVDDRAVEVRSAACRAARQRMLWQVLDSVFRDQRPSEARAWAVRGLIDAPAEVIVAETRLRECLESPEPIERYWACMFVKARHAVELLDAVRSLAWDQAYVGPARSYYEPDGQAPLAFDPKVGNKVADAANSALEELLPGSAIWREHGDWQRSFTAQEGAATPRDSRRGGTS